MSRGFSGRALWMLMLTIASLLLVACARSAPASGAGQGAGGDWPPTLRVGLIPNQAPERVRAQYEPFREYLSSALGQPVETFVATDYAGVVEAMASDRLDVAYFGAVTYLQAEQRAEVHPIVTEVDRETGTKQYYSSIIVRADSPYQRVEDLRGRKFAFGDVSSTSGSLYPRIMLDRAGFSDFTTPNLFVYTGGHDATVAAVINGAVDGGGVEKRIMERAFEAGTFQRNQVRILQESLVMGYPWVVRSKLDPNLVEKVTQAFLDIRDPDLLRLMRAVRYERVSRDDYNEARREAERLGLVRRR